MNIVLATIVYISIGIIFAGFVGGYIDDGDKDSIIYAVFVITWPVLLLVLLLFFILTLFGDLGLFAAGFFDKLRGKI